MAFLKITSGLMAKVGAATEDEFAAKFEAFIDATAKTSASISELATKAEVGAAEKKANDAAAVANDALSAVGKTDTRLESVSKVADAASVAVGKIDVQAILTQATESASATAATVLGKVGATAPVAAAPRSQEDQAKATHEKLIAEGKYDEAWAASPELQKQFINAKIFSAYSRANAGGQIKLLTKADGFNDND